MEDGRRGPRMKMNHRCSAIMSMSGKQYCFLKKRNINSEGAWANGECASDSVG